jgi:hypothetical protein
MCFFLIEKLEIKSAVKPAVKKDFTGSERSGPKPAWFLAKSAVTLRRHGEPETNQYKAYVIDL